MTHPKPCPFCGEPLRPVYAFNGDNVVTWAHPSRREMREDDPDYDCMMAGRSIGAALIDSLWNRRAEEVVPPGPPPAPPGAAICHYELCDGLPVFNAYQQGSPVDVNFLNACFDYLRNHNPWSANEKATKS